MRLGVRELLWRILELKKKRVSKPKRRGQLEDLGIEEKKTGRMRECSPHIKKHFLKIHFKIIPPVHNYGS